ncbi:hypothetical protein [Vibrio coralliilyticus]|uniref:hypothetical protein n=1 Tax=Vibrio coralliilyticus TaxID=190893 RepID=UPI001E34DAF8|nr:hypothetical protein [Vibrio coralliilyticus]MCC2525029.1 hypothetical protein [Vibrio coralliilyticus]
MVNPNKNQINQNSFFAGRYDQFIDQEARLLIRDRLISSSPNASSMEMAESLVNLMKGDPDNFTASLFNSKHLNDSGVSPDRIKDVATSSMATMRSEISNFGSQDIAQVSAQANWDFSASVNGKIAAMLTDYLMHRTSDEPLIEEVSKYVDKHIVEPISHQMEVQQSLPARLVAINELKSSVIQEATGNFAERYMGALSDSSINLSSLEVIRLDAEQNGINLPDEFASLQKGLSELNDIVQAEDSIVSVPSSPEALQTLFNREGLDISSPLLNRGVQEHLERYRAIEGHDRNLSVDDPQL